MKRYAEVGVRPPANVHQQRRAIAAATSGPRFAGAPSAATSLTSGTATPFSFPAVTSPTLYMGNYEYNIVVPEGATKLEITLGSSVPNLDLDLFVRYGNEVTVSNGNAIADFSSTAYYTAAESIVITPTSSPALQSGTYYIAIASFTANVTVTGTLTATVTGGAPAVDTTTPLSPGVPHAFSFAAPSTPTLMTGPNAFRIDVPASAVRLDFAVTGARGASFEVFLRYGTPVDEAADGTLFSDLYGPLDLSTTQWVSVTRYSKPQLQAGTWYAALLPTAGGQVGGTITAWVSDKPAPPSVQGIAPGVSANFSFDPVIATTMMDVSGVYRVYVPAGATRLAVDVNSAVDVDVYVRFGVMPTLDADGRAVADYVAATRGSGRESIVVTDASSPPLQAGIYYIVLGVHSTGVAAAGTITATVAGAEAVCTGGPVISAVDFYDAAALQRGALAPGSLASIMVPGIAQGVTGCVTPANPFGPLPLSLADISVQFESTRAPIYRVCKDDSQESVSFQVPFEISTGPATVTVRNGAACTAVSGVAVKAAAPAVFESIGSDGRRRALILHLDGSPVTLESPAAHGEVVRLFVTGLGAVNPALRTNSPVPDAEGAVPPQFASPVLVGVGPDSARVVTARYAANLIGVAEVLFEVPAGTASGPDVAIAAASQVGDALVFSKASAFPVQ